MVAPDWEAGGGLDARREPVFRAIHVGHSECSPATIRSYVVPHRSPAATRRRRQLLLGLLECGAWSAQAGGSKPSRTILPFAAPLSISACAVFRLAALIGDSCAGQRRADFAVVDQHGQRIEDLALLIHVGRAVDRPCEHQLVVDRHRFALEQHDIEYLGIVDQPEPSLRGDQFGDVGDMLLGMRGRKDESGSADAELGDLCRERPENGR